MLNRSASLAMSTSVLKALPGKLDIKRHSPSILYLFFTLNEAKMGMLYVQIDDNYWDRHEGCHMWTELL